MAAGSIKKWYMVGLQKTLMVIDDKIGGITHCALSSDGQLALSTSIAYLLDWDNYDSTTEFLPVTLFYNPEGKSVSDLKTDSEDYFFPEAVRILESVGITGEVFRKDTIISIWDTSSGTCIRELEGHQTTITDLDLSKDGKWLLSSADNGEIKIWEMETGQCLTSFFEATSRVSSCAVDRTGNIAISSSHDGDLRIGSIPQATRDVNVATRAYGVSPIKCCRYNQASDLALSISSNREIQLWNAQTGDLVSHINATEFPLIGFADVSVDRQIAIVTPSILAFTEQETKELGVFDLQTGHRTQTLSGHTSAVSACAIDQAGKVAISASNDGIVRIWDIENGTCRFVLRGHTTKVDCCALSADGLRACSGSDDTTLRIWDTQTGHCLHILRGHTGSIQSCALSANERCGLSVGSDNMLCLWDLSTGALLYAFKSETELSNQCALNVDGRLALYTAPSRTVRLIEMQTKREITSFTFDTSINSLAFSSKRNDIMISDVSGRMHFLSIEEGRQSQP